MTRTYISTVKFTVLTFNVTAISTVPCPPCTAACQTSPPAQNRQRLAEAARLGTDTTTTKQIRPLLPQTWNVTENGSFSAAKDAPGATWASIASGAGAPEQPPPPLKLGTWSDTQHNSLADRLGETDNGSATVFGGECLQPQTRGGEPEHVAVKLDTGEQVIKDHTVWSELYHVKSGKPPPGIAWVAYHRFRDVPWEGAAVGAMVSARLGLSLEACRIRRPLHRLPLPVVCAVAIQVLDTLAGVHARGFVHRDLKPGNLLLPEEGTSTLYLIDFGLAMRSAFAFAAGVCMY